MQYMKQLANGNRVSVSDEQANADKFLPDYVQIIATSFMLVYRCHSNDEARKAAGRPQKLRWGNRRNSMSPVGYAGN